MLWLGGWAANGGWMINGQIVKATLCLLFAPSFVWRTPCVDLRLFFYTFQSLYAVWVDNVLMSLEVSDVFFRVISKGMDGGIIGRNEWGYFILVLKFEDSKESVCFIMLFIYFYNVKVRFFVKVICFMIVLENECGTLLLRNRFVYVWGKEI